MKKGRQWVLVVLLGIFLVSCATAPPVEPVPKEEPAVIDRNAVDAAKVAADQAKVKADSAKAPKAAAAEYNAAMDEYTKAEKSDKSGDLEAAVKGYNSAAAGYLASADSAEKARLAALDAMNKSDKAISDTEAAADKAYREATGEGQ